MKTTLILENDFIENLFIIQDNNEVSKDLFNFISTDFSGYNLICDFKNRIEYENAVHENPLWELMLDKIDNINFNENLKLEIAEDVFYNSLGEHNLFLLNSTAKECEKLSLSRGYIYLSMENINDIWTNFMFEKRNKVFKVTNSNIIPEESKFNCWSKLNSYCTPITSILIFDKYILNDTSGQKLVNNLFPLLERLLQYVKKDEEITITIITEPKNWDIKLRQELLNEFLKSIGYLNVRINILKHYKVFYPKDLEGLHARFIMTNYFHIRSDDSFNFFNTSKKVNNDVDIRINFVLSTKNRYFFEKELNDIKRYISKLSNNPQMPKEEHRVLYYPDKNNYLLN